MISELGISLFLLLFILVFISDLLILKGMQLHILYMHFIYEVVDAVKVLLMSLFLQQFLIKLLLLMTLLNLKVLTSLWLHGWFAVLVVASHAAVVLEASLLVRSVAMLKSWTKWMSKSIHTSILLNHLINISLFNAAPSFIIIVLCRMFTCIQCIQITHILWWYLGWKAISSDVHLVLIIWVETCASLIVDHLVVGGVAAVNVEWRYINLRVVTWLVWLAFYFANYCTFGALLNLLMIKLIIGHRAPSHWIQTGLHLRHI